MSGSAIEVDRLSKIYPDRTVALDGVDLSIPFGETFACLGRNGAGKTTLIKLLTTLDSATSGSARVNGRDVAKDRRGVRACIGASLQRTTLDDLLTGREHLQLAGRLIGMSKRDLAARVDGLVEIFGLAGVIDRLVASYSGGMRRRVDIAMALVRQPTVLFLDEPTTGLDPQSRRALRDWLKGFAGDGGTILLTTQYLEEADVLADRVGVLEAGRVAVLDSPQKLKAEYGGKIIRLRSLGTEQQAALVEEFGDGIVPLEAEHRLDVTAHGGLHAVAGRLAGLGIPDTAFEVAEPTLEEVFLRLTGKEGGHEDVAAVQRGVAAIGRSLVTPRGKRQ